MAKRRNWGLIFALRTGSAAYSHKILAGIWVRLGYKSVNGMLTKEGEDIEVHEEGDLFDLLGLDFVEPEYRDVQQTRAQRLP